MAGTTEQQWTIKRLLEWTQSYFEKVEGATPRLEAEILLAEALDCQRIQLYTRFDEIPPDEPMAKFRDWVKRRATGEPVAYIVGYREFYSLRFNVNQHVLIPRPETEHVVVAALEAAKKFDDKPIRVLDIGTGSGCIAITLAKHLDDCKIAATDVSADALAVATENAKQLEVEESVRFLPGDLYDALPSGSGAVHLIVSNPPYIGTEEIETVAPAVKDHEPNLALFSGADGQDIIRRLIEGASEKLLPGGYLIFELSPIIIESVRRLVESSDLNLTEVIKDYAGHERVVVCQKPNDR